MTTFDHTVSCPHILRALQGFCAATGRNYGETTLSSYSPPRKTTLGHTEARAIAYVQGEGAIEALLEWHLEEDGLILDHYACVTDAGRVTPEENRQDILGGIGLALTILGWWML